MNRKEKTTNQYNEYGQLKDQTYDFQIHSSTCAVLLSYLVRLKKFINIGVQLAVENYRC